MFAYSLTATWSSNDPTATPPSVVVDANNTQSAELSITAISRTNITGQATSLYKNGTETTEDGWVDVNTGDGASLPTFIISANLAANDSLYTAAPYNTWIINETVPRTYSGVERDTNHLNLVGSSGGQSLTTDMYWDKSTGVLVEEMTEYTNQTGGYTTTWSVDTQITSSNIPGWTVPEFSTWASSLLILIALTSATIVIARQKQPKRLSC
jgi:hypothetical protein